jgi:F-type H+-transporting ATPase subunit a
MSLSSFVYTYIEFTDLGEKAAQLTMFTEVKNILFFTIKDILSFFSIAFLVYLLSNSSFSASKLIPQGTLEIFGETVYKISLGFFANTLGLKHEKEVKQYQELFLKVHGILIFILGANVGGMLPYSTTITSSLSNTLFIALAIFINIIIIFLKEKGLTTFLSLFMPSGCPLALAFLLVPIEFLSYFFRVLSLSVRLFANMMAGHTLLKVIAGFS